MFQGGLVWGISWVWYLIGTVGIGGTVLLFYIGPAALITILPKVIRFLLGTRVGVALLVGAIVFMVADIHRSRKDTAYWQAKTAAFEAAQVQRDKDIAQKTREEVWTEIANQTAANTAVDTDVKEFHDELPPAPPTGNPFRVGANAKRLCRIAGQTGCGPKRAQGVQKTGGAGRGAGNH